MSCGRRRRWTGALVAGLLAVGVVACEVPDPLTGETVPADFALPECPGTSRGPGCLPAPITRAYDGGGAGSVRTLDLYLPPSGFDGPHPLLVYVHGGAWVWGDKGEVRCTDGTDVEDRVCVPAVELDRGYAVASIDYRLHAPGGLTFHDLLDDVTLAVAYLKANAATLVDADPTLDIDPNRIVLVGASAGGQLASIAALTADGDPATSVAGFVDLVGPADMAAHTEWLDLHGQAGLADVFRTYVGCGPDDDPRAGACGLRMIDASPLWYALEATSVDPPGYLVCGEVDNLLPCSAAAPPGEMPYQGLPAMHDALVAAHGGQQTAAFIDRHMSTNLPANTHNPTYDLNLAGLRLFLDAVAPVP